MQSVDIDSRLQTIEEKINYILNIIYEIQKNCKKMDKHIDFVETIGGVFKNERNVKKNNEVIDTFDFGV